MVIIKIDANSAGNKATKTCHIDEQVSDGDLLSITVVVF